MINHSKSYYLTILLIIMIDFVIFQPRQGYVMPENRNLIPKYRFYNLDLQNIHNALVRMEEKIDSLIFKILIFLQKDKNWSENMLQKPVVRLKKPENVPTISYENPITLKTFEELVNPVIDSEGYIREKGEQGIDKGIYSRNPVTITESSDIKKVQQDYVSLQSKVDNLTNLVERMLGELNEQKRTISEQNQRIAAQEKRIADQNNTSLEQTKRLDAQDRIIANQRDELTECKEKIERQRTKIKNQKSEIVRLKNIVSDKETSEEDETPGCTSLLYKPKLQIREEREEHEDSSTLSESQNTKSKPHSAATGFADSIFYGFPCRTTKRNEEKLKTAAREGNVEYIRRILNAHDTDIDGRGAPDSLCAIFSGDKDKTPLMIACEKGNFETVKLLVNCKANVNLLDRNNNTALDYATKSQSTEIYNFLKSKGAVGRETNILISPTNQLNF